MPLPAGQITNLTVYSDLKTLIPLLLTEYLFQVSGSNHFDIRYQDRDQCPPGGKPLVYWNGLQITPHGQLDNKVYLQQVSFSLGLKYDPNNKSHTGFETQLSTLVDMWNPYNAIDRRYSFTFKAATYTDATLADIGIFDAFPGGSIEFMDKDCKCYTYEFPVTFQLRYSLYYDISNAYNS